MHPGQPLPHTRRAHAHGCHSYNFLSFSSTLCRPLRRCLWRCRCVVCAVLAFYVVGVFHSLVPIPVHFSLYFLKYIYPYMYISIYTYIWIYIVYICVHACCNPYTPCPHRRMRSSGSSRTSEWEAGGRCGRRASCACIGTHTTTLSSLLMNPPPTSPPRTHTYTTSVFLFVLFCFPVAAFLMLQTCSHPSRHTTTTTRRTSVCEPLCVMGNRRRGEGRGELNS